VDNGYTKRIRERVLSLEDGTVFVTSDFADIADTSTIRQSLSRLVQSGTLRRILKGVYEKPKYSKLLDEYVAVDPEAVATALARSYHWTIERIRYPISRRYPGCAERSSWWNHQRDDGSGNG